MTSFFSRLVNPGGYPAESGPRRLTLAVFGKHPGWNDHLPGIGVETELLAHVKQALYVTGIGGRIDAGAWRNLEAGKRLEGFDHTFLWLRAGHVLLGRMHSSEDGLRRKEYPLVLCLDAEGITPATLLSGALPELDRLAGACRGTTSAGTVNDESQATQDRLRALLTGDRARPNEPALGLEARRRFLEHRELGPERLGLLRVLHELGDLGVTKTTSPRHFRVPLAENSRNTSLVLWTDFLRQALPATIPLLLVSRSGTDWLDVMVGEPVSDDFFCLQASPAALPLASQVPYELSPALRQRLGELETKFTGGKPAAIPPPPGTGTPPAPARALDRDIKTDNMGTPGPASRKKGLFRFFVGAGLLMVVGGIAMVWFSGNRGSPRPTGSQTIPVAISTQSVPDLSPPPVSTAATTTVAPVVSPPPIITGTQTPPDLEAKRRLEAEKQQAEEQVLAAARAQEAKARAEAEAKRAAEAKPATQVAQVDEKHRAEDASMAQLALKHGNYARALEICQQWPGIAPFPELLAKIAVETNQLQQVKGWLQAGNYDAILTNQWPDNSQFLGVRTNAEAEKQILTAAQAEFATGSHAFLQQEAVLGLKAKLPFQKLLQAGQAEAAHLQQAQAFRAANQPQQAMDLLGANKLDKPPFAPIRQWAAAELEKLAAVRREEQQVEALFQQGDYARALNLCNQRAGQPAFDALAQRITAEQAELTAVEQKFAAGDYAFVRELAAKEYGSKPPFAELTRQGGDEKKRLDELAQLRQADNWAEVLRRFGTLAAKVSGKKPFAELRAWAEEKFRADEALKNRDPAWLDATLETMLVQFNLVNPARTTYAKEVKALDGFISGVRPYYQSNVVWLRAEYTRRNPQWLDSRRDKQLKDLENAIRYRD